VALTPDGHLWLASDEVQSLERLEWDGTQFTSHESFDAGSLFVLPGGPEKEIDIEGLQIAGHYLWLVGSHSRKTKKPKPDFDDAKNIHRLTWTETQTEPNRYLLGRIPLVENTLVKSFPHPDLPTETLLSAALEINNGSNALVDALKSDPHIGPYVAAGIPGKANGLDIEGMEVLGDRVLLGLRGPVLLDWALLIEIQVKPKGNGLLHLKKIGAEERPYRKYFVNLQGLGIRDLCLAGEDLLILSGPTQFLDGPAKVFRLPLPQNLEEQRMHRPEFVFEIPCGVGTDHPEGITLATQLTGQPALLVIYDAPSKDRLLPPNGVLADLFTL